MKALSMEYSITLISAGSPAVVAAPAGARRWSPWPAGQQTAFEGGCPMESPDGLSLFLNSNRPGGLGTIDAWVADRDRPDEPFGDPQNLGRPVDSEANDYCSTPLNGGWLVFDSNREGPDTCGGGTGGEDIHRVRGNPAHGGRIEEGTGPNSIRPDNHPKGCYSR